MTTLRRSGLPPASGVVGTARRVPLGRAVAGGLAVAAAAVLVFAAYLTSRPGRGTQGLVAAAPLAAGTRLSARDLRSVTVHLPAATVAMAPGSATAVAGRRLAVSLDAGELLTTAELSAAGTTPALRPVTVEVPVADASDLRPGQRADVLVTEGTAPLTRTTMVVRGAQVVATGAAPGGLAAAGNVQAVTLGVASLPEVEALVAAEHAGSLDLVVGEASDGTGLGAGGTSGSP